jgi:hypothetical protein
MNLNLFLRVDVRQPPAAPKFRWLVFVPAEGRPDVRTAFGPVPANTVSEARGVVKRLLGLPRLPVGTVCRKEAS